MSSKLWFLAPMLIAASALAGCPGTLDDPGRFDGGVHDGATHDATAATETGDDGATESGDVGATDAVGE